MNWLKENLVSIVSIFISAGTAIFLGIIVHSQNKKITKLNGKIERGNYVHKIQFEKEFTGYNEIWEVILEIDYFFNQLIAFYRLYYERKNELYKDKITKEVRTFYKLMLKFNNIRNRFFPFSYKKILEETKGLLYLIKPINDNAILLTQNKDNKNINELFLTKDTIEKIRENFNLKKNEISTLIENRIESLKVID